MHLKRYCSYSIITLLSFFNAKAQNRLSLQEAEGVFLKNNLFLLAKQYNINAAEALVIQSKAYPNPVFNADFNVYDPQNKKYLHVDSSGQKSFQLQQLILLGGKRKNEIEIARQNKQLAEAEFSDMLRQLRAQLYNLFYSIGSEKVVIANYDKQLRILDTIIDAYRVQAEKGNLPLKDVIRLKSVYIKINAARSELITQYNSDQRQLQILLQSKEPVEPVAGSESFNHLLEVKSIEELRSLALQNRPDLKIADQNALLAALYLKREKKQRVPDLAFNASYDQRGGAFRNQVNAGITLPIPVLNTNRGNIKAAEFDQKEMELYVTEKKLEVDLDVQQAWANMQRSVNEYKTVKVLYNEEFTQVYEGVNNNFQLRNISILEFVDFVESYNESLAEFEKIKRQLAQSASQINYVTATKVY